VIVVGHHLQVLLGRATHVALVDKDEGLAATGTVHDVTRTPAFLERFGALLEPAPAPGRAR
jgi:hypothetical protein